jgi:prefoldin subunit 5
MAALYILLAVIAVIGYGVVIELGHIGKALEALQKDATDVAVSAQRCDSACEEMKHNIQILANGISSRQEKLGYSRQEKLGY